MKTINVSELKAHLSEYLKLAARGTRIIVKDRDQPVAQLAPLEKRDRPWRDRLAEHGRLRRGTQDWGRLRVSPTGSAVGIQSSLQAVREDPHEVRRR